MTGWRRGWDHSRRAVCGLAFTELTGLKVNLEFCAAFDCLGVFSHQTLVFSLFRLELKLPFEFAGASHWPCQTLRKPFNRSFRRTFTHVFCAIVAASIVPQATLILCVCVFVFPIPTVKLPKAIDLSTWIRHGRQTFFSFHHFHQSVSLIFVN